MAETLSVGEHCEFVDAGVIFCDVIQVSPFNTEMELEFTGTQKANKWISKSDLNVFQFGTGTAQRTADAGKKMVQCR